MSRTLWKKNLIGGTSNNSQAVLYTPTGRAQTNVKAELDRLNQNLTEKIDTFSGTVEDEEHTTYSAITADGIAYDETNKQLLLKVNGADTVIPFKTSKIVCAGYIQTYLTSSSEAGASRWFNISQGVYFNESNTYATTGWVASSRPWNDSTRYDIYDIAHFIGGNANTYHLYIDKPCYLGNTATSMSTLYQAGAVIDIPATVAQFYYFKEA